MNAALAAQLRRRPVQPAILLTLWPSVGQTDAERGYLAHPALGGDAICVSTASDPDIRAGNRKLHVLPAMIEHPRLAVSLDMRRRLIRNSDVQVSLMAMADLRRLVEQPLMARLDLIVPGMDVADAFMWMQSEVFELHLDPSRSVVKFPVSDLIRRQSVEFPPGVISSADFPLAPQGVRDTVSRNVVVGAFPYGLPCHQIDAQGRIFYVADMPITRAPTIVEKGGHAVPDGWYTQVFESASGSFSYMAIVFERPVSQIPPATELVTCTGGIGIVAKGPVGVLLDYAGLRLLDSSRPVLAAMERNFPMDTLYSAQADVISLLSDRIFPQTTFALRMRADTVEIVDLGSTEPVAQWHVGSQLLYRLESDGGEVDRDEIFNAVTVRCGRNVLSSTTARAGALVDIVRDAHNGPRALRARLAASEQLHGRRMLTVNANDLSVEIDQDGEANSEPGIALAEFLARTSSSRTGTERYALNPMYIFDVCVGDVVMVHDEDGARALMRVVAMEILPSLTVVTLRREVEM